MYADDTVIYFSGNSIPDIEMKLSLDLTNFFYWLEENNLFWNIKKTECLLFGTRQRLMVSGNAEDFSVSLNRTPITIPKVFKYLGVMLDSHLTSNEHTTYVTTKVSKKLGILSRVRPLLTTEPANRLYKSMILPLLEYCDITWYGCSNENQKEIERMQNRAGRLVLKDSKELTSDAIIEKLGWTPLSKRRDEHTK